MAGYNNNYGSNQSPEYNTKPYADSTNGAAGSRSPAAQQYRESERPKATTDPYAAFRETTASWYRQPTPAPVVRARPTGIRGYQDPALLASALRGRVSGPGGISTPPASPGTSVPPTYGGDGGTSMPPYNPGTSMPPVGPGGVAMPPMYGGDGGGVSMPPIGTGGQLPPFGGVAMPPIGPAVPPEAMPGIPGATPVPSMPSPRDANGNSFMAYSTQIPDPLGDNGNGPDTQSTVGDPPGLNPPPLPNGGGGGGTGGTPPPPPLPGGGTPRGRVADHTGAPPNASGVPAWWAKEPGYEYLAGKEHLWGMYQRDATEMAKRGHPNVDFVDWLASMGLASPLAGRAGYDTFRNLAPGVPDNGGTPGAYGGAPPSPTAVDPKTYLDPNDPRLQPASGQGGTAPAGTTPSTPGGGSGSSTSTGGWSFADGGPTGAVTPAQLPTLPGSSDISSLFDPLFRQQQQELARTLRAEAGFNHNDSDHSGAYGDSFGRAEGNLINQQGAAKAQLITDQLNRNMQKYDIDTQSQLKVAQQALDKYGIDLNAYITKYGIDTNDKMQRFLGNLQSETSKAVAQMGRSSAAMQAGAARAAALLQAETQRYGIDKQADIDWGRLQADLYSGDANRQLGWAGLYTQLGLTPQQLADILRGFGPTPPVYVQP